MISFRQHAVSLVAVFLALAVGIALGGGPLSEVGRSETTSSTTPRTVTDPATERQAAYGDAFARAAAARLYGATLRARPVAVVTLAGADGDVVASIDEQLQAAGAQVTGTFAAAPALVDPGQKALVDTLGSQLATQLGPKRIDAAAPTYVRMGRLLGLALASRSATSGPADRRAQSVRQSLAGAGLLTSPADARLAPLVLLVLPSGATGPGDDAAARAVLGGLVSGLADGALGVVVVGDSESAATGGLAAVRAGATTGGTAGGAAGVLATVDGAETTLGAVTAVLALARVLRGEGGDFGPVGSDGAVPLK